MRDELLGNEDADNGGADRDLRAELVAKADDVQEEFVVKAYPGCAAKPDVAFHWRLASETPAADVVPDCRHAI